MASVHAINLANTAVSAVRCVVMDYDNDAAAFSPIAANRLALGKMTHSKNMMFAFNLGGSAHYYSYGGSTNAKYNDFALKANNILMIHEVGSANKEIYQDFYDIFDYAFNL
jgi:hypothetical protein